LKAFVISAFLSVALLTLELPIHASGHGPVFSLATPTNAKGAWALDLGLMGRKGELETAAMFRGMLSYGITQDLMVSVSFPWIAGSAPLAPGRMTGMMPGTPDVEGIMAWRFHRRGVDVGTRLESTLYGGIVLPGPQEPPGVLGELSGAPGILVAAATGYVSRGHYLWSGAGYMRFTESEGDRRPDLRYYSFAWGYRPAAWRKDYPQWDWRFFVELTGEDSGSVRHGNQKLPDTGGHQIFLGPSVLGIYRNYAIEGGVQLPVYRNVGTAHQEERLRFALNWSYFF
jgi:hypothetical protein